MKSTSVALCLLFLAPFLVLGVSYPTLPTEMPVLRIPILHWIPVQSKSLLLVLRVPFMNLIHGVMAAIMVSHASDFKDSDRRSAYRNVFLTLLFAIAFKSDFEALGLSAQSSSEPWLTYGALTSVLGGVGLAVGRGRKARLPWPELHLGLRDTTFLIVLFSGYLAIVSWSLVGAHQR